MHKHMFIAGGLYLSYLMIYLLSFTYQNKGLKEAIIIAICPLFEIIALYFLTRLCISIKNKAYKLVLSFLNTVFYFVVICQFVYYFLSGEYITLLALENLNQAYVVINWKHIICSIIFIIILGAYAKVTYDEYFFVSKKYVALFLTVSCCVVALQNGVLLHSRYAKYIYETPVISFFKNVYYYYSEDIKYTGSKLGANINSFIDKDQVFENGLPFDKSENFQEKPNIIVIFTEGTSARLIGCYGGRYSLLTPNIDDFSNSSIKINNYFNHTAATFRGTHGQLASCFPIKGGYGNGQWADKNNKDEYMQRSYQTLPNILNELGYETYFFSPHKNEDPYTYLLKMLKFQKVYVAEDYGKLFNIEDIEYHGSIRDVDMYKSLTSFMMNRRNVNPFLVCMYTLDTHAFMDVYKGGVRYEVNNSVLNTIHNLDYCFGSFWSWFKKSKYSKNTIIVFTSDHAHYYDKDYLELMRNENNYKRYFVDKIPLIIYDPTHLLPKEYDAYGSTSLDLTPTILHLLNVKYVRNSFLGNSIFDKKNNNEINIAALGNDFYYIKDNQVYKYSDLRENGYVKEIVDKQVRLIKEYYILENTNSVFREVSK